MNKKIGLSVSCCVRDIADGLVDIKDVKKIIGGTCCKNQKAWEEVISSYKETYWKKFPEQAEWIFFRWLLKEGKIEQPRLFENKSPNISSGYWVDDEKDIKWIELAVYRKKTFLQKIKDFFVNLIKQKRR